MNELMALVESARQRMDAMPSNDRRALLIMFVAIGLTIIYLSLSMTHDYQKSAIAHYNSSLQDSRWMSINKSSIHELVAAKKKAAEAGDSAGSSLINQATTSAKPFGIAFKRFQPQDENGLRLWIEGAEFDQLMRWLSALDRQHIHVDQIEISRQEKLSGIADARVLISSNL